MRIATPTRPRRTSPHALPVFFFVLMVLTAFGEPCHGRIFIDINAPSGRKFKIAAPDFKNLSAGGGHPELATSLPEVVLSDLELSGYFSAIDKQAFLADDKEGSTLDSIRFKDWTVIGAELLLKGNYQSIGRNIEVQYRLFDVFAARQIIGKRVLGNLNNGRQVMHRIANDIIRLLTGRDGIFLTKIAFVANASGHKEIYACDFDGGNVRQITSDKSIAQLPRWSPNGRQLLYNSYKDGGTMLYLKDFDSGEHRRVSGRDGLNIGAAWTPDGKQFALTLSPGGDPDIYLMQLNGKIIRKLTGQRGIDVSPSFSPDGQRLAFVSNRSGNPQIYVRDLASGSEQRLTFEGKYNTSPAWSSLGRIAFSSMRDGRFYIGVIDPEGGAPKWLSSGGGNDEDPCWAPDGRYMVFSSNRTGAYHLYLMDGNGGNQRRITSIKGDQISPSWAP